jgi:hypothetical protein
MAVLIQLLPRLRRLYEKVIQDQFGIVHCVWPCMATLGLN